MPKTPRILVLIVVLVLSFLGQGLGAGSQIHYDPNLSHYRGECYWTSFGTKHRVKPRLILFSPDVMHLTIRNPAVASPRRYERLEGTITNGIFSCYHLIRCYIPIPTCAFVKRQELTLDKKTYRKGDVVTGMIDFECSNKPIIVKGVFQTTLE